MSGLPKDSYILIIEDDEAVRNSIKDALEFEGYRVVDVPDGKEAIQVIRATARAPRLILLDMIMSGMNGWQFLDFQRNTRDLANVPVVVCSALSETARSVKPAAIISKPIRMTKLLETVRKFYETVKES